MCLDIVNRWKCYDNYTKEILQEIEYDRVKSQSLVLSSHLAKNEVEVEIKSNIYFHNTMHFDTYVPSSGVNNEK